MRQAKLVSTKSYASGDYSLVQYGTEHTESFRVYLKHNKNDRIISPFHDIPLYVDKTRGIVNILVEIPRWTHAKMEVNKKEMFNPIVQDRKNGKLRYVHSMFPYRGYVWNYGALPQTWDDPTEIDEQVGYKGDNDPLDIIELGTSKKEIGCVARAKVLGALGLIDDGEADWKIVTIDVNDELAGQLDDIGDLDPFVLGVTRDWFRLYKVPDGKKENEFVQDGKFFDKKFALEIIEKSNKAWHKLTNNTNGEDLHVKKAISIVNSTLNNKSTLNNSNEILSNILAQLDGAASKSQPPNGMDEMLTKKLDKIYYVKRDTFNS